MIPYGKHHVDENDIQAVAEVLRNGLLTQGPIIDAFEKAVAKFVGAKYAVAVSSGTTGLHLAALVAGVTTGKSMITSPITFVASSNAALYCGGNVIFTDIDPQTINISPKHLSKTLLYNKDVVAIMPVHFAGLPCEMDIIKQIADNVGAVVIEDAAHAFGSKYKDGQLVGSCAYSLMTVFSFHPVKAIAAGEGGMITTNDEPTYRKLLRLRSHGINKLDDPFLITAQSVSDGHNNPWYYEMQELGFNFRITDIQCALALSQFKKLDVFIERRRKLVKTYDKAFSNFKNIRPAQTTGRDESGHHLYIIRINFDGIKMNRAQLMEKLKDQGIGTQVHYIPVPAQPYYRKLGFKPEDYPNAIAFYNEALSIPLFYDLSDEMQAKVISALKELVG
ncbi:MAG: UDP-4-amino-4,6-dideoxy-N-acetyl-beta-L-altrosamine transaminase [Clostridiaceae bacterium]|nr:UDP-4-amino-4,6-dideoxy-N-acetyl-beta-L-altrosamine transaminase [Clostridiaceae bacterium]